MHSPGWSLTAAYFAGGRCHYTFTMLIALGCCCSSGFVALHELRAAAYYRSRSIRLEHADRVLLLLLLLLSLPQVVDCGSFLKDWSTRACLAQRPDLGEGGGLRPVVDLLVEQIEWVGTNG